MVGMAGSVGGDGATIAITKYLSIANAIGRNKKYPHLGGGEDSNTMLVSPQQALDALVLHVLGGFSPETFFGSGG